MKKKMILVLDIDGTLTNSQKEISARTKDAIEGAMERGHIVMLASGRPTAGMRRYENELELKRYGGYLLSFNGGRIINCATEKVVFQRTLPSDVIPKIYDYAMSHNLGIITYQDDSIIMGSKGDQYIDIESRINAMPVKPVSNFLEYVDFDVNKCLLTGDPKIAEVCVDELQEMFPDLSIMRSEPFFIEVMPKGIDKAQSLDRMLESLGLHRENTVCCGDGYNDISMIEYAGVGVAMGNAQDAVKKVADFITLSNDEDGLVVVIEKFIP